MAIPTTPVSMMIQPTTWMFSHDGWPCTAKARIAPNAIKVSPVAVLMAPTSPIRRHGLPPGRRLARLVGCVLAEHALPQVAEGPREQPGHVHLWYSQPVSELRLGQ